MLYMNGFVLLVLEIFRGSILKEKALQVSKLIENFNASNSGLLDKFRSCYSISFKVICGESKSVDTEIMDE